MAESTITSKNQTTVPKEIRQKLGLGPSDTLLWEAMDGYARVRPAARAFLRRRGELSLGKGSTVEDVRRSRRSRGTGE
ncbi:MAG: AbrB/MazE/SpoVT family DNA-binding domain-containing protein [Acidobacteria bacterium]|nr:AbrB/MazE/SpoVT family DNA-binding domain-containing protein [Acidobacteriota bacterium]